MNMFLYLPLRWMNKYFQVNLIEQYINIDILGNTVRHLPISLNLQKVTEQRKKVFVLLINIFLALQHVNTSACLNCKILEAIKLGVLEKNWIGTVLIRRSYLPFRKELRNYQAQLLIANPLIPPNVLIC